LHYKVSEQFFDSVEESDFSRLKKLYRTNVKSFFKKIQSAFKNAESEYQNAQTAELHLKKGKTLSANLYKLGPNNFPESDTVLLDGEEIKLNKVLSYSDNAQIIFKKAKKLGKANETSADRLDEIRKKVVEIEDLIRRLEDAKSFEELSELDTVLKKYAIDVPDLTVDKKSSSIEPKEYLVFKSSDGFTIYCGRNQEENRKVTFRLSKGNDLWMHVRGIPGSHVIIKSEKGKSFPLATLLEAAQICVFYSKVKRDKKVEVDYTLKKYVKSIKGTLAEVSYTENKTLLVSLEPDFMKTMKSNS
ncbi:MAG: NFACT RNA binding domain-containing protein, partial [Oligoflexia bacterium]|nr:NFACT RNA binding domain-containing protein [Oligoflexia bacterium]